MTSRALPVTVTVLAVVVAAGCGSDDRAESDQPTAREVVATSIRTTGDSDPYGLRFSADEADCVAAVVVAEIDTNRLEELGLDLDDPHGPDLAEPPLTADEADVVYAAIDDCVDLAAQVATFLEEDASLTDDEARCVAEEYVGSGLLRAALLGAEEDPELNDRIDATLGNALARCAAGSNCPIDDETAAQLLDTAEPVVVPDECTFLAPPWSLTIESIPEWSDQTALGEPDAEVAAPNRAGVTMTRSGDHQGIAAITVDDRHWMVTLGNSGRGADSYPTAEGSAQEPLTRQTLRAVLQHLAAIG